MAKSSKPKSWRNVLKVHPAAALFPIMSPDELHALGEDIKKNGLHEGVAIIDDQLLDGRSRLDAMEMAGIKLVTGNGQLEWAIIPHKNVKGVDPFTFVISKNIHRRHLTTDQKRELIETLVKATPEKSDRRIAHEAKSNRTTVGQIRKELERSGDVSILDTRKDAKGRTQKAHKPSKSSPEFIGGISTSPAGTIAAAIEQLAEAVRNEECADPKPCKVKAAADRAEARSEKTKLIPGAGMAPHAERGLDLYETPPQAVRALLEVEPPSGTIWEPACGPGSIVHVLRAAGHRVVATDLADHGCPDFRAGIDFLSQLSAPEGATTILTNPPYMHADDFARHALKLVPRVVMLLRLAFLESQGRSDILDGGQLARVYPFRNRLPMMHRDGWTGPFATSAVAFAWYVWDRDHRGPATLSRISWIADDQRCSPVEMPDLPDFLHRSAP